MKTQILLLLIITAGVVVISKGVRLFWNDGKTAKNKAFLQICRLQTSQFVRDMVSQEAYLSEPLVNSPDEELSQSAKSAIKLIEANARQ